MAVMASKPKLACSPNGPYALLNDMQATPVPNLRRASGEACVAVRAVVLCRCGASKNKPFCDGSHGTIRFSDRNAADPGKDKRKSYAGKRITILDDRSICSHAGFCTDELKSVFRQHDESWIAPDGAEMEKIIATIRKCPSGALGYAIDGVEAEAPERPPMITVTDNGPYAVTGGVELMGVKFAQGASTEHYTLCRCGASKNKPFCDGSHWNAGFRDPA
jgi:CDGSH-type Zn-finger protein/ferredoxin